jgi:hypothetical protein
MGKIKKILKIVGAFSFIGLNLISSNPIPQDNLDSKCGVQIPNNINVDYGFVDCNKIEDPLQHFEIFTSGTNIASGAITLGSVFG